jgi:hypothetical protein
MFHLRTLLILSRGNLFRVALVVSNTRAAKTVFVESPGTMLATHHDCASGERVELSGCMEVGHGRCKIRYRGV